MMDQVIVLTHDQPVHQPAGVDAGVVPAVAGLEGPVGQVVEEKAEGDAHHQGRGEPAVEDEGQVVEAGGCHHDQHEDRARQSPFEEFVAPPEAMAEEEDLVIEEARRDQPERPEGADDVVGIVPGIVDVGMVLQVHPGEHREAEAQQQGGAVAHHRIPETVRMGGVMAGVVDHGALQVQGEKAEHEQHRQRPAAHEPAPDRQGRQPVTRQEQAHGGIPGGGWIEELPGNAPQGRGRVRHHGFGRGCQRFCHDPGQVRIPKGGPRLRKTPQQRGAGSLRDSPPPAGHGGRR